jgi:DNA-binding transcriptional ArsR family regulator
MARRLSQGPRLRDLHPRQVETLVSPVRQEIVDAISAAGPSTVAQISTWLGVKPDRLYYHLAALVRAGLLVERERVRTGKRFGAVYDVAVTVPAPAKQPRTKASAIQRVVRTAVRLADRDFRAGTRARTIDQISLDHGVAGGRVKGWLTAEEHRAFNAHLRQALDLLRHASPRPGTTAYACTFIFAPVARRSPQDAPARKRQTP